MTSLLLVLGLLAQQGPPPLVPLDKLSLPQAEEGVTDADQPQASSLNGNALFGVRDKDGRIAAAIAALHAKPGDAELILELGRAQDTLLRYSESIRVYTDGIEAHPKDFRFRRYRGQRYISVRKFPEAVEDLKIATNLAPNSFDAAYYLALALYFSGDHSAAAAELARCEAQGSKPVKEPADLRGGRDCATFASDPNALVALQYWHYLALRRAGDMAAAKSYIQTQVREELAVTASKPFYDALLFFKGKKELGDLLAGANEGGRDFLTRSTAAATYLFTEGERAQACQIWARNAMDQNWDHLGVINSESEYWRNSRAACALYGPPPKLN
jgi:tetratricopeptide (TPR) repeat protein